MARFMDVHSGFVGVTEEQLTTMLVDNPRKIFEVYEVPDLGTASACGMGGMR